MNERRDQDWMTAWYIYLLMGGGAAGAGTFHPIFWVLLIAVPVLCGIVWVIFKLIIAVTDYAIEKGAGRPNA